MSGYKNHVFIIACVSSLILATVVCTPIGRGVWNTYQHELQQVDDETSYETKKQVEDTCRAMVSSYMSDKMIYDQYKDSEDSTEKGWSEQAKIRANKTAITYNQYILRNSYIWKDNIPEDISTGLDLIE